MALVEVESSTIKALGYVPESRTMTLMFSSGKAHQYQDMPPEIHAGPMASGSKASDMDSFVLDCSSVSQMQGRR